MTDPKLAERFWRKVEKGPSCWLWTGSARRDGYGQINVSRRIVGAHRVAFLLANGRYPEPCCCHRCDNKLCVNPAHLFEGTHRDNAIDKVAKGRANQPRGERIGLSKLNDAAVRAIRAAHAGGELICRLADRHGVDASQVSLVVARKSWRHVP